MTKKTPKPTKINNKTHPYSCLTGDNKMKAFNCPTCGRPPTQFYDQKLFLFRDVLSVKEYIISGMCQTCQDDIFGK